MEEKIINNDRPDYPCGRAPWALIIKAGPLLRYIMSIKNLKVEKNMAAGISDHVWDLEEVIKLLT